MSDHYLSLIATETGLCWFCTSNREDLQSDVSVVGNRR